MSETSPAVRVAIAPDGQRFLIDGVPSFLLADTLWSAFGRPTDEEFRAFLRLRRRQGFNAVNISVLPIAHDRSTSDEEHTPFETGADGSWDLDRPRAAYFERARRLTAMAVEHGMVPVLVVLWCNYVPGTWGAGLTPHLAMTLEQTDRHLALVAEYFADLGAVFAVSGDENFRDPVSVERYAYAARELRRLAPGALLTLHPTPDAEQPPAITGSDLVDFYAYQAGHDHGWDTFPYEQAGRLAGMPVRRPVVSMEPCYEGHGYGSGTGRHDAAHVRRAAWGGVLAGAGAGLGYGAHGVWSWHRQGEPFNGEHFSGTPFPADRALEFPGAWDAGLLRRIVEDYRLDGLSERQEWLGENRCGARVGARSGPDRVALWLPHPFAVALETDLSGWDAVCWDLGARRRDRVAVTVREGRTLIGQPEFLSDALVVFSR